MSRFSLRTACGRLGPGCCVSSAQNRPSLAFYDIDILIRCENSCLSPPHSATVRARFYVVSIRWRSATTFRGSRFKYDKIYFYANTKPGPRFDGGTKNSTRKLFSRKIQLISIIADKNEYFIMFALTLSIIFLVDFSSDSAPKTSPSKPRKFNFLLLFYYVNPLKP